MAEGATIDSMICIRDINPRGLPTRHAELFKGKPLLWHVADRLRKTKGLRDIGLICKQSDDVIKSVAKEFNCRIHDSTLRDIERRPALRRQRLWSLRGWRGGLDYASTFDEDGWPEAMLAIHEAHPADYFYVVGAEWPCLDPQLSSEMIAYAANVGKSALTTFHQGAPGFLGQTLTRIMLEQMVQCQSTLRDALAVNGRGEDNMDQQKGPGNFELPALLTQNEFRFAADSPRLHRWLEKLTPENINNAVDWMHAALETPFDDGPPGEIEWEWAGTDSSHQISQSMFDDITKELLVEPDVLITIDGRGDCLAHPNWHDMTRSLKERCCHGVHLRLQPGLIDDSVIDRLLTSRADIVSFVIDAHYDNAALNAHIKHLCEAREPVHGPRIVVEMARTQKLITHWEAFWNRWFGTADRILWRHPNIGSSILLNRRERHPCRRLARELQVRWNGAIVLCREDSTNNHVLGHFPQLSLTAARQQLNEIWFSHKKGQYSGLCTSCTGWDRLTP